MVARYSEKIMSWLRGWFSIGKAAKGYEPQEITIYL